MTIQERIWDMVADLIQDRFQDRLLEYRKNSLYYNLLVKDIADEIDYMAFSIEQDIIDWYESEIKGGHYEQTSRQHIN